MTSSTNTSTRPVVMEGTRTAMGRDWVKGTLGSTRLGGGVACGGIMLLWVVVGSHSEHHAISFARSVTSSDTAHHVGGFGEPPNVSRSDT